MLYLSDEKLKNVRDCNTSCEMWRCIQNSHKQHTLLNRSAARRNFHTATVMKNERMLCESNRVKECCIELKSI